MTIIAFVNQKGGCSKSTSAVHLASWLKEQNFNVLVVDADVQCSSSRWLSLLENKISIEILPTPNELLDNLPDLAKNYDYLIVDGPAGLTEATRAILLRADLAVVPCQPTGLDLDSAQETIYLIQQAQSVRGGLPKGALFLARAVKKTKLAQEAMRFLQKSGLPTLETIIHQRQVIADAFVQKATAWSLTAKPALESAIEYKQLFTEILEIANEQKTANT